MVSKGIYPYSTSTCTSTSATYPLTKENYNPSFLLSLGKESVYNDKHAHVNQTLELEYVRCWNLPHGDKQIIPSSQQQLYNGVWALYAPKGQLQRSMTSVYIQEMIKCFNEHRKASTKPTRISRKMSWPVNFQSNFSVNQCCVQSVSIHGIFPDPIKASADKKTSNLFLERGSRFLIKPLSFSCTSNFLL